VLLQVDNLSPLKGIHLKLNKSPTKAQQNKATSAKQLKQMRELLLEISGDPANMNRMAFRIWDTKEEKYVTDADNETQRFIVSSNGTLYCVDYALQICTCEKVDPSTGRYIKENYVGMVDDNNVPIYEGDIFTCRRKDTETFDTLGIVTAVRGRFAVVGNAQTADYEQMRWVSVSPNNKHYLHNYSSLCLDEPYFKRQVMGSYRLFNPQKVEEQAEARIQSEQEVQDSILNSIKRSAEAVV
jgi:hypothetical protein